MESGTKLKSEVPESKASHLLLHVFSFGVDVTVIQETYFL